MLCGQKIPGMFICSSYLAAAFFPARQPQMRRLAMRLERLGVEAPPSALGHLDAFKTMGGSRRLAAGGRRQDSRVETAARGLLRAGGGEA
jgi:hypothetical protein